MIAVDIPGYRELRLEHLVLDYNGTLAEDGKLLPGVATTLQASHGMNIRAKCYESSRTIVRATGSNRAQLLRRE